MENHISDKQGAQPFIKWVGGKRQLADEIMHIACLDVQSDALIGYYEPFVGGGALFYALKQRGLLERALSHHGVHLSDVNQPLIETYRAVKDSVEPLIAELQVHSSAHYADLPSALAGDKGRSDRGGVNAVRGSRSLLYAHYFKVRSEYNKSKQEFTGDMLAGSSEDGVKLAAMFLYLNRAGFNGMYRENSKGEMNIPPGRYTKPELVNAEVLRACSSALQCVDLQVRGFEHALKEAKRGDLVYLDPPYFETFTAYSKGGFDYMAQQKLAEAAKAAAESGAKVIISNSDTEEMRELYKKNGFEVGELKAARNINSDGAGRAKVTEIVAFNVL